jgi:GrpB-like predicted nucleotidyltransferase (UPF0157 family)
MIGLKRGTVKLFTTRSIWKINFQKEKKKLQKIFGKDATDIQHIGSTAIPKIFAKPIIDIGVIVLSLRQIQKHVTALKKIGYTKKRENRRDRLFFTKGPEKKRTHYLHVGEIGSDYIEDMILFRDYLLRNKETAGEYIELKKKLARRYADARYVYTKKKEGFIKLTVKKAKELL